MPFTFSHPAIVLPLGLLPHRWFSMTGLVIGSMTPDFEYFIRMQVQSHYSHSIAGLFWFDLPLGLLLAFVFHNLVRNPFYDNLPSFISSRLVAFKAFNWNTYFKSQWLVVAISIIIGAASHVLWDSFTHDHGFFVKKIPVLASEINLVGKQVPVYKILQHSSTLVGALLIFYAFSRLPKAEAITTSPSFKFWGMSTVVAFLVITIRFLGGLEIAAYGNLIVTIISASMLGVVFSAVLTQKTGDH